MLTRSWDINIRYSVFKTRFQLQARAFPLDSFVYLNNVGRLNIAVVLYCVKFSCIKFDVINSVFMFILCQ